MSLNITLTGYGIRGAQNLDQDIDRARDAAEAVLAAAGIPAADAYAEYQHQWEEFDDEDPMTGPARVWIEARQAADIAVTEGWANPAAEVFCEMSAF